MNWKKVYYVVNSATQDLNEIKRTSKGSQKDIQRDRTDIKRNQKEIERNQKDIKAIKRNQNKFKGCWTFAGK